MLAVILTGNTTSVFFIRPQKANAYPFIPIYQTPTIFHPGAKGVK
jgi:hypothetical protein